MEEKQNEMNSQSQPDMTPAPPKRSRRTFLLAAGGIAVVAVLGGAAYVAGGMLNSPKSDAGPNGDFTIKTNIDGGGGAGGQTKMFHKPNIKNAPEIPTTPSDVSGVFVRRQDNSLYVGTGEVQVMVERDNTGKSAASAKHSGPDVEVVVNRNTKLYEDKTPITMSDMEANKEIQQVLAPVASLDDLTAQASSTDGFSVWGQRAGDRVIADIVVRRTVLLPVGPG